MAEVSRTTLLSTILTNLPDNTSAEISPADVRGELNNQADSSVFRVTGKTAAPTASDDVAGTAGNGTFGVGDMWIDETNDVAYIAVDVTSTAAVWIVASATPAEIKIAYESNADTNAYDDAAVAKLAGIEALADVTDATNVDAAGAVMNTDATTAAMSFVIDEDTMATDSATLVPTQQSVKAYVDASVTSAIIYRGGYNAATNTPDLDTAPSGIVSGDMYTVTAAGTFFTVSLEIGDVIIAEIDNAAVEADWTIVNKDLDAPGIKTSYESNADTNAFDDAAVTKLAGIEALATADQTGAEIEAALDTQIGDTVWRTPTSVITVSTSRALALTDANDLLEVNTSGGAVDVTIPLNATVAFPIGTVINITLVDATAAGTVTSVTGVTLNGVNNDTITLGSVYDGISIYKAGTDSWRSTVGLTGAEIKALYEAEADTNAFDDAAVTKLAGITAGATVNVTTNLATTAAPTTITITSSDGTDAVIAAADVTNAGVMTTTMYDEHVLNNAKVTNVTTNLAYTTAASDGTVTSSDGTDATIPAATISLAGLLTGADKTKLDGIEALATADQTGAEIKTAYEAEANAFTDAQFTKLAALTLVDTPNAQTGTTYTAVLADRVITMDNAAANTLTIPLNASVAYDIGTVLTVIQLGAGVTSITGDTGVTVNGVSAGSGDVVAQYDDVRVRKVAADTWVASGSIGAVA